MPGPGCQTGRPLSVFPYHCASRFAMHAPKLAQTVSSIENSFYHTDGQVESGAGVAKFVTVALERLNHQCRLTKNWYVPGICNTLGLLCCTQFCMSPSMTPLQVSADFANQRMRQVHCTMSGILQNTATWHTNPQECMKAHAVAGTIPYECSLGAGRRTWRWMC